MKRNRGSVLVTVLAVSIILSILLLSLFATAAWMYRRSSGGLVEKQAYYTVSAGLETAEGILMAEDAYGDSFGEGDPFYDHAVRTTLMEYIQTGDTRPLTMNMDFGSMGECRLVITNHPEADNKSGYVTLTGETLVDRMTDQYGRVLEDNLYRVDTYMDWVFDPSATEAKLEDYLDNLDEDLTVGAGVFASTDGYFWVINDYADFSGENPLAYANPLLDKLFIFLRPGSYVNLGDIGWEDDYGFDVYLVIEKVRSDEETDDTDYSNVIVMGLNGLLRMYEPPDEDEEDPLPPPDEDEEDPLPPPDDGDIEEPDETIFEEAHVYIYKNPAGMTEPPDAPAEVGFDELLDTVLDVPAAQIPEIKTVHFSGRARYK